jgi:SAM-dependent methyltransferase
MTSKKIYSEYDRFAWFYNKYWGGEYSRPALAIFNVILFPHLAAGSHILDLCCGTGQIARGLVENGYRVTGLDGSEAMLRFARENAPDAEFIHADARSFKLDGDFQAVISAFDSLNHLMTEEELRMVFRNVHAALAGDGILLFDLNLEDETDVFGNTVEIVEADHVCLVRSSYDRGEKLKRYDVTMFELETELWRRSDMTLYQRYYGNDDVLAALADCGFSRVSVFDARREFGMTLSDGRMFYLARK